MDVMNDNLWDFSFELFKHLRNQSPDKNIFYSPLSVTVALSMTLLGAKEKTAEEMLQTFKVLKENETNWHAFLGSITEQKEPSPMTVANKMFVEKKFPVLTAYIDQLKKLYAVEHGEANFSGDPKGAVDSINKWVSGATKGKIDKLLSDLDVNTRVVIVNAVHFKGFWQDQFDRARTIDAPFHLSASHQVQVPLMFKTLSVPFYSGPLGSAVRLPFREKGFSLVVVLPPEDTSLPVLEDQLLSDRLKLPRILKAHNERKVDIFLPRFELRFSQELNQGLKECGMKELFDMASCDLSGVTGSRDLFVSSVVHEAVLEVNEEGAEAAAATAVQMMVRCMPRPNPSFRVDRPFLVAILKDESAVFFGRVLDPTAK